ncbi:MAG: FadR family transcriptional regulator [Xanthomonadaceae bacterium]|nr:FadR family transcriptional regulator [Xanthomonadaceae bacterium]
MKMPTLKRTRESLANEVARILKEGILAGKFAPGEKLATEGELARQFGISRNAVREAIAQLRSAELVETRHGLGTFVVANPVRKSVFSIPREFDAVELRQIFELRAELESGAAALAARNRTEEDLAAMRESLDRLAEAIKTNASGTEHDLAFHERVARASGNRFFREFLEFYAARVADAVAIARDNSAQQPGWSQIAQFEHEAIYDAIAAGNPDQARAAMWVHLQNACKRLGLCTQTATTVESES